VSAALDQILAGGIQVAAPQQDSMTNAALKALGYIDPDQE